MCDNDSEKKGYYTVFRQVMPSKQWNCTGNRIIKQHVRKEKLNIFA